MDGAKGDKTGAIIATAGHPFWVANIRRWISAGEIRPGSWLWTDEGTHVRTLRTVTWTTYQQVYNLSVQDTHTYYVAIEDVDVLVHNDGELPKIIREMLKEIMDGKLK